MSADAPGLVIVGQTDVGRYRDNNEDALGQITAADGARLVVVADGMGGFEAGEVASAAAIRGALEAWQKSAATTPLAERLRAAVVHANEAVVAAASARGLLGNTGTTLVALGIVGGQVAVAHVGDSRAYRLRAGRLEQATHDHTEAQALVDRGELAPELVDEHELSHCLTRALGLGLRVDIDVLGPEPLQPGDTWLLCSDGLTGPVADEGIASVLRYHAPGEAAGALIKLANFFGGPDNITLQIVRAGPDVALEPRPPDFQLAYEGARTRAMLGCSILLAAGVAFIVFVLWMLG